MRLAGKLASLAPVVNSADFAPTRQMREVLEALSRQIDTQIKALDKVMQRDVARFNDLIGTTEIAPLVMKSRKQG
jgi:hypothetical protein